MTNPPEQHLVLGTAGHIDHGKTALIKALTGAETDRLKEERERGISIELGYARLDLPSGRSLSVIDVPGHERFVRNMVAGASGIDIFMLVVAADDGVMPQTREHMAIIELLGIPRGIVVITKTDLVDAEMIELVKADVEEFLAATPYDGIPIAQVSSRTGEGLPQLLDLLEEAAGAAATPALTNLARLPVDRVFTLKGIGTVVTGTLWSGQICAEDSLALLPEGLTARARAVQVHDRPVACADAGQRVAVNLSGIDKDKLTRGQMLVKGEGVAPTYMIDARIRLLPTAPARLKYGAPVRLHHGTADATAKLMFVDRDFLEPGDSCLAQIRLKTKIVPAQGDRFILRYLSPVTTIGGGVVIDPSPKKHGQGAEHQHRLETLESGSPAEIVALLLADASPQGLRRAELEAHSRLGERDLNQALAKPEIAVELSAGGSALYFSPDGAAQLEAALLAALSERQKMSPADPHLTAEELAKSVELPATSPSLQALVNHLVDSGQVALKQQRYALASAEARLSGEQQALMAQIEERLSAAGFAPPATGELAPAGNTGDQDFKLVLKLLTDGGRAIKVKPDLYYSPAAVAHAEELLVNSCQEHEKITLAEFRDLMDVSRKYAQALLEYFDRSGLTRRLEDHRILRKRK